MNAQRGRSVLINASRCAASTPAFTLTVSAASGCPGLLVNGLDDLDNGVYVLLWVSASSDDQLSSLQSLADFAEHDPHNVAYAKLPSALPLCSMMLHDFTTPMQLSLKTIIPADFIDP